MHLQPHAEELIHRARRNTIGDALSRSAQRYLDAVALSFEDRSWTYQELDKASNRLAYRLLELGLSAGERVAAYGGNSDAYVIFWLACAKAGLVHVPINHSLTTDELTYIVGQSGCRALFHDIGDEERVAPLLEREIVAFTGTLHGGRGLDALALARMEGNDRPVHAAIDHGDLVQILYTSGTTAQPKGAMLTHGALLAEYASALAALEIESGDVALAALPLYHSAQMHVFVMPLLLIGARCRILRAAQPELCLESIAHETATSFFAPPTVWISLLRHPDFDRYDLRSLRKGYYGASIMPVPVLQELSQRLPVRLFNCYGQSEIGPLATVLRPEDHEQRPASAGRPVFNVQTRIVDEEGKPVPPGEHGEIVHRSPQLLLGYWEKVGETLEAFRDGWFHSGDLGYLDAEGYLYIVDRVKDVIKTGGVQVSSREVEECLYQHPAVSEIAVIALPDKRWIEVVAAIIVRRDGQYVSEAELIDYCQEHLAKFKVPKKIFFRDNLPRSAAGKLLKRELKVMYA
ncbi:MAG: AMP-binding protein [Xanthomonadaceae bacterium]|jgi:fatty-acyl-CoA synthase|nr:AMP-binding protein [Xanthomonadaceae bacterium]